MSRLLTVVDEAAQLLVGANRTWWDVTESRFVRASTAYMAFGCPDWGETNGERNGLCTFCSIPLAATGYRQAFFDETPAQQQHFSLFQTVLRQILTATPDCHTLMVFNAGSFLAMPDGLQIDIMRAVAETGVKRVVIESRAGLIKEKASLLTTLTSILYPEGKALTIRIGVETQDDFLRMKVLKKGHSRRELETGIDILRKNGITSGGYVMLNPAPNLGRDWAMDEGLGSLKWVLEDLDMDEAYFCSTNVAPGSVLEEYWKKGEFRPATLWMVYDAICYASKQWGPLVHLLPFHDEPQLIAVPSNHTKGGIPESLEGASGCDLQFHQMLDKYRQTMDPAVLVPPECSCKFD